jgi:hypothetical protein
MGMEHSELEASVINALLRPGYGTTVEEILDTCRLVERVDGAMDRKQIFDLRSRVDVSEQIWKRMLSVAKSQALWEFRESIPASFSCLYRLTLMQDYKIYSAVRDESVSQKTTTREIDDLRKRERIDSRYKLSKRQIYLFAYNDLEDQEFGNLLDEINKIAEEYDCCFDTQDLEKVRKQDSRYQYDRRLEDIHYLLRQDIENLRVIESLYQYDDIEDEQELDRLRDELIKSSFKEFLESLMSVSYTRESMMKDYGFLYCTKIAHEYWRTQDRSQRYNYKRRLMQVKKKYPDLADEVQYLMERFIEIN